jgi:hypothetical protein
VKTSKRSATVTWGLVVLGALAATAIGCGGGPDWQNQYTETPGFTGAAETPDSSTPAEDGGTNPCPGAPNCDSILWAPGSIPPPNPGNGLGNPDPVPWIDPTEMAQTQR